MKHGPSWETECLSAKFIKNDRSYHYSRNQPVRSKGLLSHYNSVHIFSPFCLNINFEIIFPVADTSSPRSLRHRSAAARQVGLWVRISVRAWMFVVSAVCCQVDVCATSWSLVQSPTDCGVSLCVWYRNFVNEEAMARLGPQRHKKMMFPVN